MDDSDLSETIRQTALGPASVSVGGVSVQAQDVSKIIEADRYLAAKRAAAKNHLGLYFVKLQPPGAG